MVKQDLVQKYQTHKDDTGSTDVQVALLSNRIKELTDHLKEHKKDFDSRRGLLTMVGKRRRLLNYLKQTNEKQYLKLIEDLKLKG
ncbi:MAG: 30S ribosomal protein S15 [Berkelbacteria bacterium GW2011_GWA2_38_9]|uniref:Small ribosomal subunit protein uS15 n=1 Tax=Berkelbacteria bacterium GW2011_GWA2_38_9 TaxID=1618334 RepID=A0A0G0NQ70_9BACT|nr:MAG: 30S ribosomal protein S15 [Berkelbacteria bacterium GW2011_GWA2_38_9]